MHNVDFQAFCGHTIISRAFSWKIILFRFLFAFLSPTNFCEVLYVAARLVVTGRIELRFCTLAPYTADFRSATFDVDRALRPVSCWGGLVAFFALRTCSAQKRQLSTQSTFIGVLASPPGVSVVSLEKHARAVAGLRAIVGGAPVLFQEYRDIAMFLNSLLDVVRESREIKHGLFVPLD